MNMMNQSHLILDPVMSSSRCMRCLSPALLSLRLTVTVARKGFLESKGLEIRAKCADKKKKKRGKILIMVSL